MGTVPDRTSRGFLVLLFLLAAAVSSALAFWPGLLAQTPARSRPAREPGPGPGAAQAAPDLSGIWTGNRSVGFAPDAGAEAAARDMAAGIVPWFGFTLEEPPMQPWAAARYKVNREGLEPSEVGNNATNPIMYPYCLPEGMPRSYTISSFEVLQVPGQVVYMLFERNHQVRRIYMDGRKHLQGWKPTFMGISHGKWDGDTLVVETENLLSLDGFLWIDSFGHPFSDALRFVERIRRTRHDTLQIDFTFDDPKAYTKPWNARKIFQLKPDWEMTESIVCEDHMQERFLQDMKSGKPAGIP